MTHARDGRTPVKRPTDAPAAGSCPGLPARRRGRSLFLSAALGLCLGSAAFAAPQGGNVGGAGQDDADKPIRAFEDTYVLNFAQGEDDDGMSLYQFARACEEVTGRQFTWTPDTETLLKNNRVRLIGSKRIKQDQFYSFFQVMMIISDFVCTEVGEADIAVTKIESLQGQGRNTLRAGAIYVEPEDLKQYANQPATLITTVVTLPNTDVRQVSNSMRTIITDANTQQMLPAGNSNSMVLVGFGSTVVAMAEMLRIIDEASALDVPEPIFDMVKLEYALAEDVQPIIEELLEAQSQTRANIPGAQGPNGGAIGGRNQAEASITVEPRTNSLLIMSLPDQMPRIKELIARLDVDIVERERSYHIYSLENVSAEELAETLNDFLDDAVQLDQAGSGAGAGNARGGNAPRSNNNNREFVVVPDPETNALLIAANRTRYKELQILIEQLDQRQDQVLIETALVELSSRDVLNIGVELGLAEIPGVGEEGGFGVTGFGLSNIVDSDGDGVPDLRTPALGSGLTAGILDGDDFSIPMLLSLLETKQNSNVLNVPSVLVNNNSSATVSTKDLQPTTTVTLGGGVAGQTQENFNDYQEAGITMEISPSISASRYLRLEISLEVSTFLGEFSGPIPPPKVERSIDTQVNVPDGSTMVIGGIVVDNESENESQVPWLGDIPLLGRLFQSSSQTSNRTVLYFFVTPHILQEEDFADLAEISFKKKLEAVREIGIDRMRKVDERFGIDDADGSSISLEGFDLPLYVEPTKGEIRGSDVGLDNVEATRKINQAAGEK